MPSLVILLSSCHHHVNSIVSSLQCSRVGAVEESNISGTCKFTGEGLGVLPWGFCQSLLQQWDLLIHFDTILDSRQKGSVIRRFRRLMTFRERTWWGLQLEVCLCNFAATCLPGTAGAARGSREEIRGLDFDWNKLTNCNSILAHQGPWLSNAAAFSWISQSDLIYTRNLPVLQIKQFIRTWTAVSLLVRQMSRICSLESGRLKPDSSRPLTSTWDVPMASHWTSSCNEKNSWQILEVVTKLGGQQFPGFYWHFTRHETRVFLQNRAWSIGKRDEPSKEDKGFLKTRKNLQHVSRLTHQ